MEIITNNLNILRSQGFNELKDIVDNMFGDSICDADTEDMVRAFLNVKHADPVVGLDHVKELSKVCNELNSYYQEIFEQVKYYDLYGQQSSTFEKSFIDVCSSLKRYIDICNETFIIENIQRIYDTVLFNHENFKANYEEMKVLLKRRQSFSTTQQKRYSYLAKGQSFIKWIWNYKYALYISGKLLYNTTIYVFPEKYQSWVDTFVGIFSMITFSLAEDRIMLARFVKFVVSSFTVIIANFFTGGFINLIINSLPRSLRKTFEIAGTIIFYLIMEHAIDTLHTIAKLTCNTIILGGITATGVETIINHIVTSVNKDLIKTKEGIEKLYTEVGIMLDAISAEGLVQFMSTTVTFFYNRLETLIKKIINIPTSIASNLWSKVTGGEQKVESALSISGETDTLISHLSRVLETPADMSPEDVNEAVKAILIVNSDEFRSHLHSNMNIRIRQSVFRANFQLDTIWKSILDLPDKTYNMGIKFLEKRMKKMGTYNIWKNLNQLNFNSDFLQYIIPMLLIIDMLSIIFSG